MSKKQKNKPKSFYETYQSIDAAGMELTRVRKLLRINAEKKIENIQRKFSMKKLEKSLKF